MAITDQDGSPFKTPVTTASDPIEVDLWMEQDRRTSVVMARHGVPVVKRITVRNAGNEPLHAVKIRVDLAPWSIEPYVVVIGDLPARGVHSLEDVRLPLDQQRLASVSARTEATLVLCAEAAEGSREDRTSIEVLPPAEWGGVEVLPEILAAFVVPDDPALKPLLDQISERLEVATGDPSLQAYEDRDPERVGALAAALHGVIQDAGIVGIDAPAHFESRGQAVRRSAQILLEGGTPLDLALLAVSLLERIGLNSLVILFQGHAMPAIWTHNESFTEATIEDPLRLRKRVELGDILVWDLASATRYPHSDFVGAQQLALSALGNTDAFVAAIDMRESRERGMGGPAAGGAKALPPPPPPVGTPPLAQKVSSDRLDRWKARLLDLSLRNRLLNFKEGRQSIPLLVPDPASLEDALWEGSSFRLLPAPVEWNRPPDAAGAPDSRSSWLADRVKRGILHVPLPEDQVSTRLLDLYRAARSALEESGAGALFLTLGVLYWTETPKASIRRRAPLIMLPAELRRGSAREPFMVGITDEEARINVTLVQKLAREHGIVIQGLDLLPEDSAGLDVAAILELFRRAVVNAEGWEVANEVHLGLFSFNKHLMWKDLQDSTDILAENPVVAALLGRAGGALPSPAAFPMAEGLDQDRDPAATFCPLDADSSQLVAVHASDEGHSFVLQGPPGTGKSQTITNLIAQNLARGRRVLFVSEKMAALNVVHQRLCRVGLAPFCLELHSDKARKSDAMRQIREAVELVRPPLPGGWVERNQQLAQLRAELNAYSKAASTERPAGWSLASITHALIALRDVPSLVLGVQNANLLLAEQIQAMELASQALQAAASRVGTPDLHPWRAVGIAEWDPTHLSQVRQNVKDLAAWSQKVAEVCQPWAADLGLEGRYLSALDLTLLHDVGALLQASPVPATPLITRPDFDGVRSRTENWLVHVRQRSDLWHSLGDRYTEAVLQLNLEFLAPYFARWARAFFLFAWLMLSGAMGRVRAVVRQFPMPRRSQVADDLAVALKIKEEDAFLGRVSQEAGAILGEAWLGRDTDSQRVQGLLDWCRRFRAALESARQLGWPESVRLRLMALATQDHEALASGQPMAQHFAAFQEGWRSLDQVRARLVQALSLDETLAWGPPVAPDHLIHVQTWIQQTEPVWASLRDWCAWVRAERQASSVGLGNLTLEVAAGRLAIADLPRVFRRSLFETWLNATTAADPRLKAFHGLEHNEKILRFREMDAKLLDLSRQVLRATLASRLPEPGGDDVGEKQVLAHQLRLKSRQMPLRRLFQKCPNLLARLKPCVLMSPLSVAQYLDPHFPPFDLVVFDEASQIPPWDAVGAIARGRQVVVVGDSQQLPPTSFFAIGDGESVLEDDFEELESILDECASSGLPDLFLRWHYRSRHEDLITFSNHNFYGRRLVTFPASETGGVRLGVIWKPVAGCYDKGGARTNRAEAEAVVEEILRRLRDPLESTRSMGVVTFSMPQQVLVEDLLEEAREKHPDLDAWFTNAVPEPIFVKNLENVQGDERDIILFSICYGPDAQGKVAMNFGPLNRSGGERRLNVAITRAREQLLVFSTLKADQVDLSRTAALGVRCLKSFLDYAARGAGALVDASLPGAVPKSPFVDEVRRVLQEKGWVVEKNLGSSDFRVDLAVADPARPGSWLIGVTCDGENYHEAATSRDRDRLRGAVLLSLGWRLHHLWSTDWWHDPEGELARLEMALQEASSQGAAPRAPGVNPPNVPVAESPGQAPVEEVDDDDEVTAALEMPAPAGPIGEPALDPGKSDLRAPGAIPYLAWSVEPARGTPAEFEALGHSKVIRDQFLEVVNLEAPITFREAVLRVCAAWGGVRATEKILRRFEALLVSIDPATRPRHLEGVLWRTDQDPSTWRSFRLSAGGSYRRAFSEIPISELANAAEACLKQSIAAPPDLLARRVARLFGSHAGSKVLVRMEQAIRLLVQEGRAHEDQGQVRLP